jgi:chorismate synthase
MGLPLSEEDINVQLSRRQMGYGRGGRMKIERDEVIIFSGVYQGKTTGSPIALQVVNRDYENWRDREHRPVHAPRPGHGDFAGVLKYGIDDARVILERASARETTNRVAVGAVAEKLLRHFDMEVKASVVAFLGKSYPPGLLTVENLNDPKEKSEDPNTEDARREYFSTVDIARKAGDTFGGVVQISVKNVPPGLGSHVHWDRRIDSALAGALVSIPSVKAVEIGDGVLGSSELGSTYHDPVEVSKAGTHRTTNHAGGIEAGITNGETLVARVHFKPIATLRKGLPSVHLKSGESSQSDYERSDVTVIPAATVVAQSIVSFVVADLFLDKFYGDTISDIQAHYAQYRTYLNQLTYSPFVKN